jgi:hypothetical protein
MRFHISFLALLAIPILSAPLDTTDVIDNVDTVNTNDTANAVNPTDIIEDIEDIGSVGGITTAKKMKKKKPKHKFVGEVQFFDDVACQMNFRGKINMDTSKKCWPAMGKNAKLVRKDQYAVSEYHDSWLEE